MKQNSQKPSEIAIIGAGLTGPLLAIYLAKRGYRSRIFERRPDMRREAISAGRSINLALASRGIKPLREVGLFDKLSDILIPMYGRVLHDLQGKLTFQPYGKDETEFNYSVSRTQLSVCLMNALEESGMGIIEFNQRCLGADFENKTLSLRQERENKTHTVNFDTVIGADGSASALRHQLTELPQFTGSGFNHKEEYLSHGYKELTIPATPMGGYAIEKNALHIWPRGGNMLIALPNTDGTFTVTLFLPMNGPESFATLSSSEAMMKFFNENFPDATDLMPTLATDFFANPTGSLVTVKCFPWHLGDRLLLLGDAAHAVVPFHGQGMNCGFEDCSTFAACLDRHGDNWENLFSEFETLRKPNADAIAELSLENFVEMRDSVRDPKFLLKKKAELVLEEHFSDRFIPRYAMIMFHPEIPYQVAQQRGEIQETILDQLCSQIDTPQQMNLDEAKRLIHQKLGPLDQV